ncbi:ferric reductase NAD binding domain-containing protein [Blyttiomyces helicus]|uniref:Ferric reductase NAD binding domain-containing protein n=1 Tax=Blyttiomyces helicus TaxID=388810 RepID=A0A4P9WG81_9FUNG|nr:ferric reductase NAD binding domain-containing protein [Blyttiomyces helicus]|eukprot:RKO91811.1 ferric reductase NAD binding domain-containing protein [Blyttiomyces helicus]
MSTSVYYGKKGAATGHEINIGIVPTRTKKSKTRVKFDNWMVNEGPKTFFTIFWVLLQIGYFAQSYYSLQTATNLTFFRSVIGQGLPMARGAANVINLNCALLLFTVCRNLISMVRTTFLNRLVPFDKNITFHIFIAWCIVFWTYVHVIAHYFNYYNVERVLGSHMTAIELAFVSGPGLTGQVISVAFFLMVTSAVEAVRRKYFEIFWFTHHLFVIFFGGLLMHGSFCFIKADAPTNPNIKVDLCRGGPQFWKWWVASAVAYLVERIVREWRGRRKTYISKVVQHPSKVVEVQIKKPSCTTRAGQYIFISCPEIALYEWHPFTLTSSPNEDFISIHIRVVGDWTTAFAQRLGCRFGGKEEAGMAPPTSLPLIMIDGPFGSASEDVFDFEASILVGAGIGVTPFASILKTIWFRMNNPNGSMVKLRKVYFIWVCRDKDAFEWFQDLLMTLEEENIAGFLEIHSYLTGGLKIDEVKNIIVNDEEGVADAITGLRSPTYFGRPNWDQIFKGIRSAHRGADIGVFFCGPKILSGALHRACNKWTEATENGTRFFYGKENF